MIILWIPPCVMDRIEHSISGVCRWEPSNHPGYVIFIAVVGHHGPCVILMFCYIKLTIVMIRRVRSKPKKVHIMMTGEQTAAQTADQSAIGTPLQDNPSNVSIVSERAASSSSSKPSRVKIKDSTEWKIFLTMSVIIISYFICWVPFHVVFDLSAYAQELVPDTWFVITFWMTYVNSALNPILYAFSNRDLRKAFANVMRCRTA